MFKILLVDDSATDRRLIEGLLRKSLHFEVETASDGLISLEKIQIKARNVESSCFSDSKASDACSRTPEFPISSNCSANTFAGTFPKSRRVALMV